MDLSLERDSSALGSLFQQIINDMKVSVIDLSNSFKQSSLFCRVSVETEVVEITWKNSWKSDSWVSSRTVLAAFFPNRILFCLCLFFQWKTREIESFVLVFCFVWNEPDTCCKWENCSICNWASCVNRLESYQVTTITVNSQKEKPLFVVEILYRVSGPGSRSVSRTFGLMLGSNSLYSVMPRPNLRAL